jgi:translocation and assembly module TamB
MNASTPASPDPASRRPRRGLAWALTLTALAIALIAGGGALLVGLSWTTEPPLAWLLARVPGLTVDGLRGTLRQGDFSIRRVDWRFGPGARLQIDDLRLEGLTWHGLYAMRLRSAQAARVQFDSGPPADRAPTPPASLVLPIRFEALSVQVGTLRIDQLPPMQRVAGSVALGADGGERHRVVLRTMDWESARLQGNLEIGTTGSLPLSARLQAQALGDKPWSARAEAQGPLALLDIQASVEGRSSAQAPPLALQAEARVRPFAAWPLAALNLQTRQFDLAALSPRLPATLIEGSAEVSSSGMDQPASARIALTNGRAGRLDEGRLPVRALQLVVGGEPRHPERLSLQRFDLQLGNGQQAAGRAGGSGRWADGRLALQLTLDDLLPGQLDRRVAPLQVSGPLTLEVSGLTASGASSPPLDFGLRLQGRLAGRSLDGTGLPVQLALQLDGDARRWTLRDARAEAGAARASAQAEAVRTDAGWRLAGRADLQRFDPLPWWRGTPSSPWRRGLHELNASLEGSLQWLSAGTARPPAAPWTSGMQGSLALRVPDSRLAGVSLTGRGGGRRPRAPRSTWTHGWPATS